MREASNILDLTFPNRRWISVRSHDRTDPWRRQHTMHFLQRESREGIARKKRKLHQLFSILPLPDPRDHWNIALEASLPKQHFDLLLMPGTRVARVPVQLGI
jgi:hypothetical protein